MNVAVNQGDRIMFVDDEPQLLESLSLSLRRSFDVVTCNSGMAGLQAMESEGPFSVIVSDMQMPGMNGVEFLRRARMIAPDTVRILLTGQATLESAIAAVNEGHIFQFLTKPCSPKDLLQSLNVAVVHHGEITAERSRLEERLRYLSQQLVQVDRLATRGGLPGALAHELENITRIFLATIQQMETQAQRGQPPKQNQLDVLMRVGRHLLLHSTHLRKLGQPTV